MQCREGFVDSHPFRKQCGMDGAPDRLFGAGCAGSEAAVFVFSGDVFAGSGGEGHDGERGSDGAA